MSQDLTRTISGFERVRNGRPESDAERESRIVLESVLRLALGDLKDGRDPSVVAHALRNALVTA